MTFAAHLDARRRTGGRGLLVDEHLERMDPAEADLARQLLATRQSAVQVAEAFTTEGYPTSGSAVSNWRRANPS